MKVCASVELVMQLAGQEAIAAEFKEIEPEHCLAAIFKLAELPVEDVDKLAPGAEVARQLAAEVRAVREELAGRSIDSTRARRKLREKLGKGKCPYDGGQMHRSPASREIFDAAGRLADDAGGETLMATHLLEAMLAKPTPAMKQVLGGAAFEKVVKPSNTPLLDEHGRDLTRMAAGGELPPVPDRQAECKALMRVLAQGDGKSVFLISGIDAAAMSIVTEAAHAISRKDCPASLKSKRIVDITALKPVGKKAVETMERLEKLLAEAAGAKDVVLVVPAIDDVAGANSSGKWLDLLKDVCTRRSVPCICRLAPAVHEAKMAKDQTWRRIVQVLWIKESPDKEVPSEL